MFCAKSRLLLETFVFEQKIKKKLRFWDFIQKNRADPPQNQHHFFSIPILNQIFRHVPDVCTYCYFSSRRRGRSQRSVFFVVCEYDSYSWRKVDFSAKCNKILAHKVGGGQVHFEIDQIPGVCLKTSVKFRLLNLVWIRPPSEHKSKIIMDRKLLFYFEHFAKAGNFIAHSCNELPNSNRNMPL